jgi:hypothetical protein
MVFMRTFSRKSLVYILSASVVFIAAPVAGVYLGFQAIQKEMIQQAAGQITAAHLANRLAQVQEPYLIYGAVGLAGIILAVALILWLGMRRLARHAVGTGQARPAAPSAQSSEAQRQATRRHQERLFLHLLCLLQREGRLLDFLAEDLAQYEDAQIGAAVRGVHESCKKTMDKNIRLQPVIDQPEGEPARIDPGFDPQAVKLTGHVTGEPPFNGILRHRGWRTAKLELPTLSDVQDPGIIAPAEVEII